MKTVVIVIIFSLLVISTGSTFAEEELPLATGEWPPYTSEKLEEYGFLTILITTIVQEMGMTPKYTFYPWKRCEMATLDGDVFGTFPYAKTEIRQQDFNFSDLILKNRTLFFYHKKHLAKKPIVNSLRDLKQYRMGGALGYDYIPVFKEAGLNIRYAYTDELTLKNMYRDRLDIAVWDSLLGWHLIQKLYPDEKDVFGTLENSLETVAPSLKEGHSYMMISRNYPNYKQLQDKFNQAFLRIKEKGIYHKILLKHGIRSPGK